MTIERTLRCDALGCEATYDMFRTEAEIKLGDAARKGWLFVGTRHPFDGHFYERVLCPMHGAGLRIAIADAFEGKVVR